MSKDGKRGDIGHELMKVPSDFPRNAETASMAGVQPKLAVIRDAVSGSYVANRDNEEVTARFTLCEDLAEQLAGKCKRNRDGKYANLSNSEILSQLQKKLLASGWGSSAEMTWTAHRTAEKLGWPWDAGSVP